MECREEEAMIRIQLSLTVYAAFLFFGGAGTYQRHYAKVIKKLIGESEGLMPPARCSMSINPIKGNGNIKESHAAATMSRKERYISGSGSVCFIFSSTYQDLMMI